MRLVPLDRVKQVPHLVPRVLGGLVLLSAIVGIGFLLSHLIPLGGLALWSMAVGAALAPLARRYPDQGRFARASAGLLLRIGIVLLGIRISLGDLAGIGPSGLLVASGTVAGTLYVTTLIGRRLKVDPDLTLLLATGTAICGASAIAAMAAATRSRESNVGYSLATISVFGTVAMVLFPPLGEHLFRLDEHALGVWFGASIHEVAQVAGAGTAVSLVAVESATLVKLARVVMLGPVVALRAATLPHATRHRGPLVPWFVIAFLAMIGLRSAVDVPTWVIDVCATLSTVFLAAGLGGLGLQIHTGEIRKGGIRPVLLGALATVAAASISLLLILATGI